MQLCLQELLSSCAPAQLCCSSAECPLLCPAPALPTCTRRGESLGCSPGLCPAAASCCLCLQLMVSLGLCFAASCVFPPALKSLPCINNFCFSLGLDLFFLVAGILCGAEEGWEYWMRIGLLGMFVASLNFSQERLESCKPGKLLGDHRVTEAGKALPGHAPQPSSQHHLGH